MAVNWLRRFSKAIRVICRSRAIGGWWVGFLVSSSPRRRRDDSVVLSTYLEEIFDHSKPGSIAEICEAVVQAGLKRIRAHMGVCTTVLGLLPSSGPRPRRRRDGTHRAAIPRCMAMSVITMFIVPCLFSAIEEWKMETGNTRTGSRWDFLSNPPSARKTHPSSHHCEP
jgi:hypothetical protein